jgi:hypothetical protein
MMSCFFSGCISDNNRSFSNNNISFSRSEIEYFKEIALVGEHGTHGSKIVKWLNKTVMIKIHGYLDKNSSDCLNIVINDFNNLSETTQLKITDNDIADIDLYFIPDSEFSEIEPHHVPTDRGFFWIWVNNCEINKGRILISNATDLTPDEHCHLIREELTQSLGLAQDSEKYPTSIFYQEWTCTTYYNEMDKNLIRMLYSTNVPLCGKADEVESYFNRTTPHISR